MQDGDEEALKEAVLWETARETAESNKIQKIKHACIVEAHESERKLLEFTLPRNHEDHIAEKGVQFH